MSDEQVSNTDFRLLEQRVSLLEKTATDKNYVNEALAIALGPWKETIGELVVAMREMKGTLGTLGSRTDKIYDRHDKLLEERADNERKESLARIELLESEKEELKNNTFVKRYGPGVATGVGITLLIKFLLDVVYPVLTAYQQLPRK